MKDLENIKMPPAITVHFFIHVILLLLYDVTFTSHSVSDFYHFIIVVSKEFIHGLNQYVPGFLSL